MSLPVVSAIVICLNERHFLEECLSSLSAQTWPETRIYFVDNGSTDGSVEYVREAFPHVKVLCSGENLGYATANNWGMDEAFKDGADFALLVNCDTRSSPEMVEQLVASWQNARERGERAGLVQPCILLYDQPDKINTIGNAMHYLGFVYCRDYLKSFRPPDHDLEIKSVSGAAMLVSREYYLEVGKLDEDFFAYIEDHNLSWRGMMKGYRHILASKAVLFHKYNFHRRPVKMYHFEKNRLMMIAENYETKTIVLLLPIIFLCEAFLCVHSIINRWFPGKIRSYSYIVSHLAPIMRKRKRVQRSRMLADRDLFPRFEAELNIQVMQSPALKFIVNPLFRVYYRFVSSLI